MSYVCAEEYDPFWELMQRCVGVKPRRVAKWNAEQMEICHLREIKVPLSSFHSMLASSCSTFNAMMLRLNKV